MKKIISLILALVLVLGLAVSASAEVWETGAETDKNEKEWPVNADGTFGNVVETGTVKVTLDTADPIPVYKVDVKWESLVFHYTAGNEKTASWNPDTHLYVAADGAKWDKTSATITVTNHSSEEVNVVTSIDKASANGVSVAIDKPSFELASAIGTTVENAPKNVITVSINGTPETNVTEFNIGTVTVTVSPTTQPTNP